MSRKTHKLLVLFIATVLVVVAVNLSTTSAYMGINPRVCKELARLFTQNPALLVDKEFEQLGDCVNFYKTIAAALESPTLSISEVPKAKRFESSPKNYLEKSLDFYSK